MIDGLAIRVSGFQLKEWLVRTAEDASRMARIQDEIAKQLYEKCALVPGGMPSADHAERRARDLRDAARGATFFAEYIDTSEVYRITLKELVELRLESLTR